jgi:hypothetical protein
MSREIDYKQQRVDEALAAAWVYIDKYFDAPAFIQLLDWKTQAQRSVDRSLGITGLEESIPLIMSVELWKSKIMFEYLMIKKPAILLGNSVSLAYDMHGAPPVSFTDIFLTVNVAMRPEGWEVPDVSEYLTNNQ